MRAVRIEEWGGRPRTEEVPDPEPGPGEVLVALRAASVNPVDLAIGSGRFYADLPQLPYTPGVEAVGEVVRGGGLVPGTRVWTRRHWGGLADLRVVPVEECHPVPDGVDDHLAVGLGVAGLAGWMPVAERGALGPGERVLVLGANGSVGRVALWSARARGAGRVVAAARSASLAGLEALADAVVPYEGDDLPGRLRAALGGPADLVVDPVWGAPAVAALTVLGRRGRLVQVGNAAGPEAAVPAGPLRGGLLDIRGFSMLVEDAAEVGRAYGDLCRAAARHGLELPVAVFPLEDARAAWERQAAGPSRVKVVVVP